MNKKTIIQILEEVKQLDDTDRLFIFGFSKSFKNELLGMRLALDTLKSVSIGKESMNSYREAELLGELVGRTAYLLTKPTKLQDSQMNQSVE